MSSLSSQIFARIGMADVQRDLVRNIVSIRVSQDLWDDLSDSPADWEIAQRLEMEVKLPYVSNHEPVIRRPFEEAEWANAVQWPFNNWQSSRFSDGSFGVWYGSETEETTVYESAHHWYHGLIRNAGFEREAVVGERKLYNVRCSAALLDFRPLAGEFPDLLHPSDYSAAQGFGARLHSDGMPGLVAPSVRDPLGNNFAVFRPEALSNPRPRCYMTYRLEPGRIVVEKTPGQILLTIPTGA